MKRGRTEKRQISKESKRKARSRRKGKERKEEECSNSIVIIDFKVLCLPLLHNVYLVSVYWLPRQLYVPDTPPPPPPESDSWKCIFVDERESPHDVGVKALCCARS